MLSELELQRYSRQIILQEIGIEGQEKLKNASVLVVGAGGLGCPCLQSLTAIGIGKIGIIDSDIVDITNLQRQILYNVDDIGKSKSDTAKQKLMKSNPHIDFTSYNMRLTTDNINDLIKDYDIIIGCPDNFNTRLIIDDACKSHNKPFVFGAVSQFVGQVSVFNYKGSGSYRDLFFHNVNEIEENNDPMSKGIIGALTSIIGSMQANEAIKIILDKGTVLNGKLFVFDILNMETNIFKI